MHIQVLGKAKPSCGDLLKAFSKLYRSSPTPPHFYLVYDAIYEPERSEVVVKLLPNNEIDSYVLLWRGPLGYGVHVWGFSGCELLEHVAIDASKPAYVQLYSNDKELVECTKAWLHGRGFRSVEVKRFYEMMCSRELFKPSQNEYMAVRITEGYAEQFKKYMLSRNRDLPLGDARNLLVKRQYYAIVIDGEIVSAAAICNKLPEAGIVCDVYTKPEFRGRGYAKAVTSATTRRIVETDAVALLYVEIGNEPAIKVYTELGYKITRTLPWVAAHP